MVVRTKCFLFIILVGLSGTIVRVFSLQAPQTKAASSKELVERIEKIPSNASNHDFTMLAKSIKEQGLSVCASINEVAQARIDLAIQQIKQEPSIAKAVSSDFANAANAQSSLLSNNVKIQTAHTDLNKSVQQANNAWKRICTCNGNAMPQNRNSHSVFLKTDTRPIPYQLQGHTTAKGYNCPGPQCTMQHMVYIPEPNSPEMIQKHVLEHELIHVRFADHAVFEKFNGIASFGKKAQAAWNEYLKALEFRADSIAAASGTVEDSRVHEQARTEILAFVEKHQLKNNGTHPTSKERLEWMTKIRRLKECETVC